MDAKRQARRWGNHFGVAPPIAAALFTLWSLICTAELLAPLLFAISNDEADGWSILEAVSAILAVFGTAGAWFSLGRRAYGRAILFLLIQTPAPFLIAANQCDVAPSCAATDWARLPPSFLSWRVTFSPHTGNPVPTDEKTHAAPHHLSRRLTVYPAGSRVPGTFLQQAMKSDLGGHSTCFADWETKASCDAYVLDIYGDGATDVLLVSPDAFPPGQLAAEIFKRGADGGWAKSGELAVDCPDAIEALRKGEFTLAAPKARDVVLSGRQFGILSNAAVVCSKRGAVQRRVGS